jgi:hypothetical protein
MCPSPTHHGGDAHADEVAWERKVVAQRMIKDVKNARDEE